MMLALRMETGENHGSVKRGRWAAQHRGGVAAEPGDAAWDRSRRPPGDLDGGCGADSARAEGGCPVSVARDPMNGLPRLASLGADLSAGEW